MKYIDSFVALLFMFSLCALDSDGWWAMILLIASGLCLGVIAWRRGYFEEWEEAE